MGSLCGWRGAQPRACVAAWHCLTTTATPPLPSQAVVEAAVQALLSLPAAGPTSGTAAPQDLLLTALAVAGPATAAPLAEGVLRLFELQLTSFVQPAVQPAAAAWRAHPLSRALLSNPAAAQPLLLGAARLLARAAERASSAGSPPSPPPFAATLAALRPFLSLLLLDPQLAAAQPQLPGAAHSALARVACCAPSPAAQLELLGLLAAHLPALRLAAGAPGGAQQVAAALADVMDVVESCTEEPGGGCWRAHAHGANGWTSTAACLARSLARLVKPGMPSARLPLADAGTVASLIAQLVCLSHEAAAAQAPALLQQLLAAMAMLAGHWPAAVAAHAASLGALLLQHPIAAPLGAAEAKAALALLASLLQHHAEMRGTGAAGGEQLAALLLLPLLQQVAFGGSKEAKQWAGHALALLRSLNASAASGNGAAGSKTQAGRLHGAAAGAHASQQLLRRLWQHPLEARHWTGSLRLALAASSSSSREEGGRPAKDAQQLDSNTLLVACALLQHPAEPVQRAVLRALVAALGATPLLGLSLLPLLVHQLQGQVERFLSGEAGRKRLQACVALCCVQSPWSCFCSCC